LGGCIVLTRGEKIQSILDKNKQSNIGIKSVAELSEAMQKTKSYIYQIIRNEADPSIDTLRDIARLLGVSVGYLEEDIEINEDVIYYNDENILKHLSPELREWVLKEESVPFLTVGMIMDESDLSKLSTIKMGVLVDWLQNEIAKRKK
jgi:transcriptional regulator with XRE-family HTH domain